MSEKGPVTPEEAAQELERIARVCTTTRLSTAAVMGAEAIRNNANTIPCDVCRYSLPAFKGGKQCIICPAEGRER